MAAYLLPQVHGAQLGRLHLGVHHHVEHGADGLGNAEVGGPAAPLKLGLERRPGPSEKHRRRHASAGGGAHPPAHDPDSPFDAGLDHVAGHELQPRLQVLPELLLRPVEVPDEGLQRVQLPEEVLRGPGAVAGNTERQAGMRGGWGGLEGDVRQNNQTLRSFIPHARLGKLDNGTELQPQLQQRDDTRGGSWGGGERRERSGL